MKKIFTQLMSRVNTLQSVAVCAFLPLISINLPAQAQISFAPVTHYATGGMRGYKAAVGDVNGDGKLDIVSANHDSNTIGVLLGTGGGLFTTAVTYSTGSYTGPYSIALGDVNGDGKLDAVTCNDTNDASVLFGTGTGGFGAPSYYDTGINGKPQDAQLGDINGDGKLDIIALNFDTSNLTILFNNGQGRFPAISGSYSLGSGNTPEGLALSDINADGRLDVVTVYASISNPNDGVVVLLNNGNGTLATPVRYLTGTQVNYPNSVAVNDINGDGKLDIVTGNEGEGTISVLLNTGAGNFAAGVTYTGRFAIGETIGNVTLKDMDGDGKPDIIVPNQTRNLIRILRNNGSGVFTPVTTTYSLGTVYRHPYSAIVTDINGDGTNDIVTSNLEGSSNFGASLSVFLNTTTTPLATTSATGDNSVILYPNPAHTTATISLPVVPGVYQADMQLIDAVGRVTKAVTIPLGSVYELNLGNLSTGLYFVRLKVGEATITRRLAVE